MMNSYMQMLIQQLLTPQQPQLPRNPNNIDKMVVPPFGLPNDKNTYMPNDITNIRTSPWAWGEKI